MAKPLKHLTYGGKRAGARNNAGRITTRHRGGGEKRLYRLIDFEYRKRGIPARVEAIEYDPNRTARIARLLYQDGERRYVLAADEMAAGHEVQTGDTAPLTAGNSTLIERIPVGSFVYNVTLRPGERAILGRAAGTSLQVLAQEDGFTHLKLPSGEVRRVHWGNFATIGAVGNRGHNMERVKNAGRMRHRGRRPIVRGSVMNPVDHPYGGGEGRAPRGTKRPKDIWGNVTGGRKTRNRKKSSNQFIVVRRKPKRKSRK